MAQTITNFPISATESLSEIELKISHLIEDKPFKVRFASALDTKGALGTEVAMLQLIGTWIKMNRHETIFHSYQKGTVQDFSKLCSSIYGIAALSLADEIWDASGSRLARGVALEAARKSIEALKEGDFSNSFKSRYFGVPYIKKPSYDKEFDMPFYNQSKVIGSDAFYRSFERILSDNIAGKSRLKSLRNSIDIQDLSDIAWELFKNTHDHGRSLSNGDLISTNFRSIIIQQPDIDASYFSKWLGKTPTPPQVAFAEHWKKKGYEKYPFLELSIVDFGEGFVGLARQKADVADEKKVILQCLKSGWSRLPGSSRGDGLTKVINAVCKHKGWLRVRTGKYLIEKTFEKNDKPSLTLSDIREMPTEVAGTSFHISFYLEGFQKGRCT